MLSWKGLKESDGEGERNARAEGSYKVENSLNSSSVLKDFFPSTC